MKGHVAEWRAKGLWVIWALLSISNW
jgi:hypothetical protein